MPCSGLIVAVYRPCTGRIHIDITAVLRAVFYIASVLACNILYLPEGASPRRRYFRIARRAPKARVQYDFTARMHEDDIVYIHQRAQRAGIALKTRYSPLVDISGQCPSSGRIQAAADLLGNYPKMCIQSTQEGVVDS